MNESSAKPLWKTFAYCEIHEKQFSEAECRAIVSLHQNLDPVTSKIKYRSGELLRDCDLFWIPRNDRTEWIFARLWTLGNRFNENYGFELSPDMGMAQLTRYWPGQKYDWHMDLGSQKTSLRKISIVVQLNSRDEMYGGGTEIFYGDALDNRTHADIGDVVIFPSFIMHRASVVQRGIRWSLVVWLAGCEPFQ